MPKFTLEYPVTPTSIAWANSLRDKVSDLISAGFNNLLLDFRNSGKHVPVEVLGIDGDSLIVRIK